MNKKKLVVSLIIIILLVIYIFLFEQSKTTGKREIIKEDQIEDYTADAVSYIMKEYDSGEAIKAVSVLVRTCYAYGKVTDTFDSSMDYINQMYNKEDKIGKVYKDRIKKLCSQTSSQVVTYNDEVIFPFFHYVSPLVTRTKDVESGIKIPYLRKVICKKDIESKYFIQIKYFKKGEINRISSISKGNKNEIASRLNLRSCEFVMEEYAYNPNIIRIVAKGKGNGMGLCINDAYNKAKQGKNYKELLNYYYKKIQIKKMYY